MWRTDQSNLPRALITILRILLAILQFHVAFDFLYMYILVFVYELVTDTNHLNSELFVFCVDFLKYFL